jgi:G3E family GTPase
MSHGLGHVPETQQYDISSLVFRARRPFHPARLWALLMEPQQQQQQQQEQEHSAGQQVQQEAQQQAAQQQQERQGQLDNGSASAVQHSTGSCTLPPGLLRAKGFLWMASMPQVGAVPGPSPSCMLCCCRTGPESLLHHCAGLHMAQGHACK